MPKRDGDDSIISELGNWNVADQYTKGKIMKPLNRCDYYEDIASFGYESIIDELINYDAIPNDIIRYNGLKRLVRELIRLIDNAKFALKKAGTKQTALSYKNKLEKIQRNLYKLVKVQTNQIKKTKTLRIRNLVVFELYLSQVSKIKSKINEPLNANHLIFVDKEEFDPRKFKKNLKYRMVNEG